jgi:putative GTP pyrophosphokinase
MHDVAGCRVIFKNIKELNAFRSAFHKEKFKHERITQARDQFNYLDRPKNSGYRGAHAVYRYRSTVDSGQPWAGLLIELQYSKNTARLGNCG